MRRWGTKKKTATKKKAATKKTSTKKKVAAASSAPKRVRKPGPVTVHLHMCWETVAQLGVGPGDTSAICRAGRRAKVLTADPEQATCLVCRDRSHLNQGPDGKWYPKPFGRARFDVPPPRTYSSNQQQLDDAQAIDTVGEAVGDHSEHERRPLRRQLP